MVNPRRREARGSGDLPVSFVPMAAVDERWGEITRLEDRPLKEVARGYSSFQTGDVLFAKITPCMENGKVAVARDLTNGIGRGSTEFYVLRPGDVLLGDYLFFYLRQPSFREQAKRHFTGTAGQQRVPKSFMENALIPLPSLKQQRRIVAIVNRAAKIEEMRAQAEERLREFVPALFVRMFGDPVENPKGWHVAMLSDLGSLDRGRSRHRPRNAPELYGGPYPFVQTGDIAGSDGVVRQASQHYSELGLRQSKIWPVGTLCITIAANIGATGVLAFDACFPDSVVGFVPKDDFATVEYVQSALDSMQARIEEGAPMAAQRNINLRILRALQLPVPPVQLQRRFSSVVRHARATAAIASMSKQGASTLTAALMRSLLEGAG